MTSVQINNVTKRFGEFLAVKNLTLDIPQGEFVALLGPSGCGKTTTMNMIAGLEEPSEGTISFNGSDLSRMRLQDRNIGFVFQNYAIFTHLSVYKNLSYGLEVRRLARPEIDRKVQVMAKRMGLLHCLDDAAGRLSVNEMQKLAIGRSAIVEPRVFLLDEPLSNLDASFRAYMRAELKVLQREFGQTMIYVTHDQIEAMSLADKIAIIDKGRLMQYGAPLDVYNNPHNRFVANFVGSPRMNLLDGSLTGESGHLKLLLDGGAEIVLSGRAAADFAQAGPTQRGSYGIRPQHIYAGERRAADDMEMMGRVEEIERVGPIRLAYLQVDQTRFLSVDEQDRLRPGDEIAFYLTAEKSLAFDHATGARLGGRLQ
ncbi:ABC transporter ATP-binding protein [Bradyrhizobium sp. LA7.1]|uniref:ABC transporter ATP-binding protein n=1 Tax=Bradyrhizobium sp. LA7.1 TaxID=3156324 RepID=UPI00339293B7